MVVGLKIHEALLEMGERGEIVGSEDLSLEDGEIDFNLIDPAGMNGGVYKKGIGPAGADAFDCLLTAMSRAVIHDPKDALGGSVGFAAHDLSDEAVGGSHAAFLFAVSEEFGTMHVPSRQIGPCALSEILVFDAHGSAGSAGQGGLLTASRLYAGFLISRDDEL